MNATSNMDIQDEIDKLQGKIRVLNSTVWQERGLKWKDYLMWINNFSQSESNVSEQTQELIALHLLSKFLYFNNELIRKLLKSLYVDVFRTPLVHKIRRENNNTLERSFIEEKFHEELSKTRFIGMGNPAESGYHLLYFFRQENRLNKKLFIHGHEALLQASTRNGISDKHQCSRYVFIDDFCGTGKQAERYSKELVPQIKSNHPDSNVWYCPLIATELGLEHVRENASFDTRKTVLTLDDTFKCFSDKSRYFRKEQNQLKIDSKLLCEYYGNALVKSDPDCGQPLGYDDSQLLISFHHNTPNNTLPIFWATEDGFTPIFHRYPKEF